MTWYTEFKSAQANEKHPPNSYRQLAQDNIKICQDGFYTNLRGEQVDIKEARDAAIASAKLYRPDYKFSHKFRTSCAGEIEFTCETTTGACHRLIVREGIAKTVALNFANPHEPGGGFLRGALAQEECICRTSILYNVLDTDALSEMYTNCPPTNLFSDYMSLVSGVPMIRDDEYEPLDEPFRADFITCAAPLASRFAGEKKELDRAVKTRVRKIIQCAAENGYDAIILGAFGCGAFGNSTRDVAYAFRKVLLDEGMSRAFNKIVFAIYSETNEKQETMQEVFNEERKKDCQVQ